MGDHSTKKNVLTMQGVVDDWHHVVREEKIAVENQGFVDYVLMESLYTVYIYIHMCMIQSLKHGGTLLLSIPKLNGGDPSCLL